MSTPKPVKVLLQRYQQGLCTPEEMALLEIWFDQVQLDDKEVSQLSQSDEDRLVNRLKADPRFVVPHRSKQVTGLFSRMPQLAAAVCIGAILTGALMVWFTTRHKPAIPIIQELAFVEVEAGPGKRVKMVLPDSSVVWMNSGSRLAYHPRFTENRQVRLQGEAFFKVTADRNHPFTVHAGAAMTRVYGTAFNVAAWGKASELRVALQHGRIGVTADTADVAQEQLLLPGQAWVYNRQTLTSQLVQEDTADMGAWVSGKLVFNKVPLKELLTQLESMYAIHCVYPQGVPDKVITARFDHESLAKILEHISFGWNVQFEQKGDTLIVQ